MLSIRLVQLIETHWEEIATRLIREIKKHPETGALAARPESELRAWCRTTTAIFMRSRVGGSGQSPGPVCGQPVAQQTRPGTLRCHPSTGDSSACVIVNGGDYG